MTLSEPTVGAAPVSVSAPTVGVMDVSATHYSRVQHIYPPKVNKPVAAGRIVSVFGEAIVNCEVDSAA